MKIPEAGDRIIKCDICGRFRDAHHCFEYFCYDFEVCSLECMNLIKQKNREEKLKELGI